MKNIREPFEPNLFWGGQWWEIRSVKIIGSVERKVGQWR